MFILHIFENDEREDNTLFDEPMLLCMKADLELSQRKNLIEVCLGKRQNNRVRIKLITNFTNYSVLLE